MAHSIYAFNWNPNSLYWAKKYIPLLIVALFMKSPISDINLEVNSFSKKKKKLEVN